MRQPGVAGYFYPADPETLTAALGGFYLKPPLFKPPALARGIIAPHAGYQYSGQIAATAYQAIQSFTYDGIILLGPTHRMPLEVGSVLVDDAYLTPLGRLTIDFEFAQQIVDQDPRLKYEPEAFNQEHSLEVHLPFIQKTFSSPPPIVPILVGAHSFEAIESIAQAILKASDPKKRLLVVASSDLSHFYSAQEAEQIDHHSLSVVAENSISELGRGLATGKVEMCGFGPIMVLMMLMKAWGISHNKVLDYTHSGKVSGDQSRVVGYGSVVYY